VVPEQRVLTPELEVALEVWAVLGVPIPQAAAELEALRVVLMPSMVLVIQRGVVWGAAVGRAYITRLLHVPGRKGVYRVAVVVAWGQSAVAQIATKPGMVAEAKFVSGRFRG